MVGKVVKRPRLHLVAPKPTVSFGRAAAEEGIGAWPAPPEKVQTFLPSNIFAGVKIDPKTLVKKLDADSRSIVSVIKGANHRGGQGRIVKVKNKSHSTTFRDLLQKEMEQLSKNSEEKKVPLSKKDKMKLRKEKWLQRIEDIKLAKKLEKAAAKRKATPVVGDMNPLMEALPELSDLVTVSKFAKQPKTQAKKTVTNFSQMKLAQKRRVLEDDITNFHKMLSDPSFKASPLTLIGEHLSKRLRQEREGEPL